MFSGFIPGKPKPQPRPRVTIRNVRGRQVPFIYSPQTDWRREVNRWARKNYEGEPLSGPLRLTLHFTLPRMKTVKREAPTGKREGDIDNLIKAVLDAMNEIVWEDDSQVIEITSSKTYTSDHSPETGVALSVSPYA